MPRNYKKKRNYRKRRPYRKRRYVPLTLAGTLGKSRLQRFKYVDRLTLNPSATNADTYTFRLNSLFDPDYTSTGHQPIGFDQVMTFYNHYTVLGAKIKATFISQSSDTTGIAIVGIDVTGNSAPTTAINDLYEQGRAKKAIMTGTGSRGMKVISKNVSLKKFLAQKDLMSCDDNAGTASSNPLEVVYGHLFATSPDSDNIVNPNYIDVLVEIDFIARLHEPKNITGS